MNTERKTSSGLLRGTVLGVALLMGVANSALAIPADITLMSSNVGLGKYFDVGTAAAGDEMWSLSGVVADAGFIDTTFSFPSYLYSGTMDWSADLDVDLSSGNRAEATFLAGTLSLTGTITNIFDPLDTFTGLLMTGTVSPMHLRETGANSNFFDLVQTNVTFTPTGGYLTSNANAVLLPEYFMVWQFTGFFNNDQGVFPVDDFSENIFSDGGSQWGMVPVPEPATLSLVGLGALAFMRRRK